MKKIILFLGIAFILTAFCMGFSFIHKATITYYAKRYNGRKTALGQIYSDNKLTCATNCKRYLGHHILFRNKRNKIIVFCNDLMANDTIIRFDLTTRAFKALNNGSLKRGVMHLTYQITDPDFANK